MAFIPHGSEGGSIVISGALIYPVPADPTFILPTVLYKASK